ncbi:MAG TPA: KUP/HAK/KT family potassium transporter [Candidatus Aquilonibacter sp.]
MILATLGVVFGDIGTSPLYTLTTCYQITGAAANAANTLGILSLVIWALILVVCVKYVTFLMRADHEGEGGILALLAIVSPPRLLVALPGAGWLVTVVAIGAAMLIGDGMITPAISVISAVEGLGVATTAAQPYIVPISAGLLLALFLIQFRGTQRVGSLFGPVMLLWFMAIAIAGIRGIAAYPAILRAFDPLHALWFITHHGWAGFLVFGAVVLCVTGVEALYADLSHFGRIPITWAWYGVVFPALLLNYLGQGAYVIVHPAAVQSPFYALVGGWALLPMVALATLATVIASQALISGAFTLCEQAIAMNLCPRLNVLHTSTEQRGQVYVPLVNALLAIVCLLLVVTFRSSAHLASAFGLAVACTMLATSITYFVVATHVFKWKKRFLVPSMGIFVLIDVVFVASSLPKFLDGAWVPLLISAVIATISLTWLRGRRALSRALADNQEPLADFLAGRERPANPATRTVLLTNDPSGVPFVRHHDWMPAFLADKTVVLLHVTPAQRPYIEHGKRVTIERIAPTLYIVHASFGYMEQPSISRIFHACAGLAFPLDDEKTTFFFSAPAITGRSSGGMRRLQRTLFIWLARVSRSLVDDLEIPPNQRIGLGIEVRL